MSDSMENAQRAKKRNGLGRGLGSLLGGEQAETPTSASTTTTTQPETAPPSQPRVPEHARIWHVGLDKIHPNPNQPRKEFSQESLDELTSSVRAQGILQPLVVRKTGNSQFEIVAGERRWRAAQQAGLGEVPVLIKDMDSQSSLELALIENIQREDLNPVEEAEAYSHLLNEYGLTQQQLAQRLGKERTTITNILRLLSLTPEVRQLIASDELTLGHAKVLAALNDAKTQTQTAKEIQRKQMSVRAAERYVRNLNSESKQGKTSSGPDPATSVVRRLSQELQKLLGTRVSIDYSQGKGKVAIYFYSDEELNSIVERIKGLWQK